MLSAKFAFIVQQISAVTHLVEDMQHRLQPWQEKLEKHLTNESWQPPMEKGDNGLQPQAEHYFVTGSSPKACEPKEHSVQRILQKHRSKYDDPCRLLTHTGIFSQTILLSVNMCPVINFKIT